MAELTWHYGPTADDPNPGSMWCYTCGKQVYFIDGVASCCDWQDGDFDG